MATTEDVLARIVALLLALADQAERAAGAPEARRRLALALIRQAEIVAGDFVGASAESMGHSHAPPAGTLAVSGDSPEDAMALALSFRALALILQAMTVRTRGPAFRRACHAWDTSGGAYRTLCTFIRCLSEAAFPVAACPDTS